MNIFYCDESPYKSAQALCDKHIVKMPVETAQILSTVTGVGYKPTHRKHPCVLWAGASLGNFLWLVEHGFWLCCEYSHRYQRRHASHKVIELCAAKSITFPSSNFYTPPRCWGEFNPGPVDVITGYRMYLQWKHDNGKPVHKYTRQEPPSWLNTRPPLQQP